MFRKICALFLTLTVFLLCSVPAFAEESVLVKEPVKTITVESLLEKAKVTDSKLSRGAFAVMLTNAAGIQESEIQEGAELSSDLSDDAWYAGAVKALLDRDVLRGFANKIYPDRAITGIEALALVGRILGIPEDVSAAETKVKALEEGHWGYGLYSWMVKENLTFENVNPLEALEPETAAKFLVNVFGTDEQAKAIMDAANEKNQNITSFRAKGNMAMGINMAGEDVPAESIKTNMTFDMEYNKKTIHQKIETAILGQKIVMEQYMDKDYIYTSSPDAEGKTKWIKMKNFMPMVFGEDFLTQQQNWSKDIEDLTHYRFVGKENIDGKDHYKIAMYARLEDFNQLLKQMEVLGIQGTEALEDANSFINSISMRGITYIDVEQGLPTKMSMNAVITMNEEIQKDSPAIMKEIKMDMDYDYYDDNAGIEIQIPGEVINAEEQDLGNIPADDIE